MPPYHSSTRELSSDCWRDLPGEIVRHIATFLCLYPVSSFRRAKHDLATCGQVCRHWAQQVRLSLFSNLDLKGGPEDAAFLLSVLRSPSCLEGPHVRRCIRKITYHKSTNAILPLLQLGLITRLAPAAEFKLVVDAGRSGPSIDGASLLRCFPRTLPPAVFPRACTTVVLRSTRFRCFADAVGFVRALPAARELHVSFQPLVYSAEAAVLSPAATARIRFVRARLAGSTSVCILCMMELEDMELHRLIPSCVGIATLLEGAGLAASAPERLAVGPGEWKLVQAAVVSLASAEFEYSLHRLEVLNTGSESDHCLFIIRAPALYINFDTRSTISLTVYPSHPTWSFEHTGTIRKIEVDIKCYICSQNCLDGDERALKRMLTAWTRFEENLLQLRPIPDIHLILGYQRHEASDILLKAIMDGELLSRADRRGLLTLSQTKDGPRSSRRELQRKLGTVFEERHILVPSGRDISREVNFILELEEPQDLR